MASKVTFLKLNGLLLASVTLFVFVYSDLEFHSLNSQIGFWMNYNCTFPPRSLYEEIESMFEPCFKKNVEEKLSLLCSTLFRFSIKLCTIRPELNKYFTEESVDQKSNIDNICLFAYKYFSDDKYFQSLLGQITNVTYCRRYCEERKNTFAQVCKLFIAGARIYKEGLSTISKDDPGETVQLPSPVTKEELKLSENVQSSPSRTKEELNLNETKTQLGSDVKNASLLNMTDKSDIFVASSIEIDTTPEIFSEEKTPTLPLSDVANGKIGPTNSDSQPTSSQQEKPSDTDATDKQTLVPSNTQDTSTFITNTIGTTQPEYSDNQSKEKIDKEQDLDIEKNTSNENSVHDEHDEKSTETENQDDNYFDDDDDPRDTVKENKNTEDDTHNKTQDNEDDSTKNENTEDDSHNKSKNVQGNSDEKDQNMEPRPVSEDNQETDQDRDFIPKSGVNQKIEESNDDSSSSSHFMAYFVTALVLCIAGYVIYHNKQKIIAFFLEGRRNGRRRAALGNIKYSKLTPSVEEVVPSLETAASAKNFIY